MTVETEAFRNGRHCGRLISKVRNPHKDGSKEAEEWELGYTQGRQDMQDEFREWQKLRSEEAVRRGIERKL